MHHPDASGSRLRRRLALGLFVRLQRERARRLAQAAGLPAQRRHTLDDAGRARMGECRARVDSCFARASEPTSSAPRATRPFCAARPQALWGASAVACTPLWAPSVLDLARQGAAVSRGAWGLHDDAHPDGRLASTAAPPDSSSPAAHASAQTTPHMDVLGGAAAVCSFIALLFLLKVRRPSRGRSAHKPAITPHMTETTHTNVGRNLPCVPSNVLLHSRSQCWCTSAAMRQRLRPPQSRPSSTQRRCSTAAAAGKPKQATGRDPRWRRRCSARCRRCCPVSCARARARCAHSPAALQAPTRSPARTHTARASFPPVPPPHACKLTHLLCPRLLAAQALRRHGPAAAVLLMGLMLTTAGVMLLLAVERLPDIPSR